MFRWTVADGWNPFWAVGTELRETCWQLPHKRDGGYVHADGWLNRQTRSDGLESVVEK